MHLKKKKQPTGDHRITNFSPHLSRSHEVGSKASEGGEGRSGEPDAAALRHAGEPGGAAP